MCSNVILSSWTSTKAFHFIHNPDVFFCSYKIENTMAENNANNPNIDDEDDDGFPNLLNRLHGGFLPYVEDAVFVQELENFNDGTGVHIHTAPVANLTLPRIGVYLLDGHQEHENALVTFAEEQEEAPIPTIKEWLYPPFRCTVHPVSLQKYYLCARDCVEFCYTVSKTLLPPNVLRVPTLSSALKKYETSVRVAATAAAIMGCSYGFGTTPPASSLSAIEVKFNNHESAEYKFYHGFVMSLCCFIFAFVFPSVDQVKWDAVSKFKVTNIMSTHTHRPRIDGALWSNAFVSMLRTDGENSSKLVNYVSGHNFEMVQLLDAVIPGYWAKLTTKTKFVSSYLLKAEHENVKWQKNIFKKRLYPWDVTTSAGEFKYHSNLDWERRGMKRTLMNAALLNALPYREHFPVPPPPPPPGPPRGVGAGAQRAPGVQGGPGPEGPRVPGGPVPPPPPPPGPPRGVGAGAQRAPGAQGGRGPKGPRVPAGPVPPPPPPPGPPRGVGAGAQRAPGVQGGRGAGPRGPPGRGGGPAPEGRSGPAGRGGTGVPARAAAAGRGVPGPAKASSRAGHPGPEGPPADILVGVPPDDSPLADERRRYPSSSCTSNGRSREDTSTSQSSSETEDFTPARSTKKAKANAVTPQTP